MKELDNPLPIIPNDVRLALESPMRDRILEAFKVPKELLERDYGMELDRQHEVYASMWGLTPPGSKG